MVEFTKLLTTVGKSKKGCEKMKNEELIKRARLLIEQMSDKKLIDAFTDILKKEQTPEIDTVRLWLSNEIEYRNNKTND